MSERMTKEEYIEIVKRVAPVVCCYGCILPCNGIDNCVIIQNWIKQKEKR